MIKYYISDIGKQEYNAIEYVIASKWLTHGKQTEKFENQFADICGVKYALALNSATACLHLACLIFDCNLTSGSNIEVTPVTYAATWQAIKISGYNPIFTDIDNDFNTILQSSHEITVHYAGKLCNINKKIIHQIEDCAHRFPSELNGHIACYSFYANKLITTGEGGMLVTNDETVRDFVYSMRYHGRDKYSGDYNLKYPVGYKYNMSDINAAIGIEQLKKMPLKRERHLEIADLYNRLLDPEIRRINDHTCHYHLYPIWSEKAEQIKQALKENDIEYSHHYKIFVESPETLPNAYKMSEQEISLPIYTDLKNKEIKYICEVVNRSI